MAVTKAISPVNIRLMSVESGTTRVCTYLASQQHASDLVWIVLRLIIGYIGLDLFRMQINSLEVQMQLFYSDYFYCLSYIVYHTSLLIISDNLNIVDIRYSMCAQSSKWEK